MSENKTESAVQDRKDDAEVLELTTSLVKLCSGRPPHIACAALARALARVVLDRLGLRVDSVSYEALALSISCAAMDLGDRVLARLRMSNERPS